VLNQPVKYLADGKGRLKGLRLVRTALGKPDASGRRAPAPIKGSEWVLDCTAVVEAIGTRADAADWSALAKTDDAGLVVANGKTGKTSARKVFAGGDIVRGPALVVEAVQDGKLAARAIGAALSQEVTS
jgi:NADPH-dependent glutamate synthase beta subunit-like oxidoreductase